MIVGAIVLIGIGGSVIKPCISGTVQKVSGARATLGFAIFYMVINIGSLFGRGTAFVVRNGSGTGTILAVVGDPGAGRRGASSCWCATPPRRNRSQKDIWVATAGFTATVVAAAILVAQIYGATAAERVGDRRGEPVATSSRVAMLASVVAFFDRAVLLPGARGDAARPSRSGRSAGSCSTWCWCCGAGASRST